MTFVLQTHGILMQFVWLDQGEKCDKPVDLGVHYSEKPKIKWFDWRDTSEIYIIWMQQIPQKLGCHQGGWRDWHK